MEKKQESIIVSTLPKVQNKFIIATSHGGGGRFGHRVLFTSQQSPEFPAAFGLQPEESVDRFTKRRLVSREIVPRNHHRAKGRRDKPQPSRKAQQGSFQAFL